jgi:GntR family transcriptional regulator
MVRQAKIRSDPRPLYQRAEEALMEQAARMKPGEQLPPEPVLAQRMGISRATLREALRSLAQQGRLVRRQGIGTFVGDGHAIIENGLEVLESLDTLGRRLGLHMEMGGLRVEQRPIAPAECICMKRAAQEKVWSITRVILEDHVPIAYLEDVVPIDFLQTGDLKGFSGSVLDLLRTRGAPPLSHSLTQITAVAADRRLRALLDLARGAVLLKLEACLTANGGMVVDYSNSYFVPGYFRFHVVRRVGGDRAPRSGNGHGGG